MSTATVRLELPAHLRTLARLTAREVSVQVRHDASITTVLDALERLHPMLCGTIRDSATGKRRPFLRFFASQEDLSHLSMEAALPGSVLRGEEPLLIIGAVAGGTSGHSA